MARRERRHSLAPQIRDRIAERLKEAQLAADIKTEELAKITGISMRLVQKHRAGTNSPSYDSLARYAVALNKPVSWFLTEAREDAA